MESLRNESEILERLAAPEEEARYKALLELREVKGSLPESVMEVLRRMETDSSRPVRQLARDIYLRHSGAEGDEEPMLIEAKQERYPGSLLLAIISGGSALSGLLVTAMSLVNYYMLGHFPFPNPIDVLLVVNLLLTMPYLLLAVLLLIPGRAPKLLARYYAYFSLILCVLLIAGLAPAFERYWAFQFTLADQDRFRSFLSPFQLLLALMPVVAGQLLQIYYTGHALAVTQPVSARNKVDTSNSGG